MLTRDDITDQMILEYLRTLNIHITKTELATAFNIVTTHTKYVPLNHNLASENTDQVFKNAPARFSGV